MEALQRGGTWAARAHGPSHCRALHTGADSLIVQQLLVLSKKLPILTDISSVEDLWQRQETTCRGP